MVPACCMVRDQRTGGGMTIDGTLTDRVAGYSHRRRATPWVRDTTSAYPATETPIDMIGGGPFRFRAWRVDQ